MIGNDIVDLKHSASNWKRQRFLDKVFTKKEQFLVLSSENQHQMLWLLWSMKEAAYKVYVQQFGEQFFNPKRLVCALISETEGFVSINNVVYVTTSEITEDYVYTIANANRQKATNSSVIKTEIHPYRTQSSLLKQAFIESVSETTNIEPNVLNIKKTKQGVPQLFINSEISTLSFSLTHCGRFSGFVYC